MKVKISLSEKSAHDEYIVSNYFCPPRKNVWQGHSHSCQLSWTLLTLTRLCVMIFYRILERVRYVDITTLVIYKSHNWRYVSYYLRGSLISYLYGSIVYVYRLVTSLSFKTLLVAPYAIRSVVHDAQNKTTTRRLT